MGTYHTGSVVWSWVSQQVPYLELKAIRVRLTIRVVSYGGVFDSKNVEQMFEWILKCKSGSKALSCCCKGGSPDLIVASEKR